MSSSSVNRSFPSFSEEGESGGKSQRVIDDSPNVPNGRGVEEEQLEETSFGFTGVWSPFASLLQRQINRLQELDNTYCSEELEDSRPGFADATPDAPDALDTLEEGLLANPRSISKQTAQGSVDDVQERGVSQLLDDVTLPLKGEYYTCID